MLRYRLSSSISSGFGESFQISIQCDLEVVGSKMAIFPSAQRAKSFLQHHHTNNANTACSGDLELHGT